MSYIPLAEFYKQRIRWHLNGLQSGIPLGDLARLEQAMDQIPDTYARTRVYEAIDRCDDAYAATRTLVRGMDVTESQSYIGDINRTVTRAEKSTKLWSQYWDVYQRCIEELANRLWAPYFYGGRGEYRHERNAGYVME